MGRGRQEGKTTTATRGPEEKKKAGEAPFPRIGPFLLFVGVGGGGRDIRNTKKKEGGAKKRKKKKDRMTRLREGRGGRAGLRESDRTP